jgi:BolA family transcriptional regulator, general stress-responsive regulator
VNNNQNTIDLVTTKLQTALEPEVLEIEDQSAQHVGHPGAKLGQMHLKLTIKSKHLATLNRVQQHQLIYQQLDDLLNTKIHALAITVIN